MTIDADRLAGLARTKLERLVRSVFPDISAAAESFNAGVGLAEGDQAFVYLMDEKPSPIAAALAWGETNGARDLHVVLDDVDPVVSSQAAGLDPAPTLWHVSGHQMERAEPSTDAFVPLTAPDDALRQIPALEAAGLDVVCEHGVVIGEVLGLEVARVAIDVDGDAAIRVGVGLYDQEAHALLHGDAPIGSRLREVGDEVRRYRRADAAPHPLNRLARERWLRSLILSDPGLVGLDHIADLEPLAPRPGIHDAEPAAAVGTRGDESSAIVVCSTGIDLDLVPVAAAHLARQRSDDVILVLPDRDHHSIIERMGTHLRAPFALVSVGDPWP